MKLHKMTHSKGSILWVRFVDHVLSEYMLGAFMQLIHDLCQLIIKNIAQQNCTAKKPSILHFY